MSEINPYFAGSSRSQQNLQLARDVMFPISVLHQTRDQKTVKQVQSEALPGQILLVSDGDFPTTVFFEDQLCNLPDPDIPLSSYRSMFIQPAFTGPDTPIRVILSAMTDSTRVRWVVVREHKNILGIVPPSIYVLCTRMEMFNSTLSLFNVSGLALFGRLFGPKISTDDKPRYCCECYPSHCITQDEAEKLPSWPHPICEEDGKEMVLTI